MPEATKQPERVQQTGQVVDLDKYRQANLAAISDNVGDAIGTNISPTSILPKTDHPIPIHIPTGNEQTTPVSEKEGYVAPPGTFQKPNSNLFTHLIHGEDRTGKASEIVGHKREKGNKLMKARNNPSPEGIISNIKDWFYDEDKKAA